MSDPNLFVAVQQAAEGLFDVVGELGANAKGVITYLARELASGELVVLKLEPGEDPAGGVQFFLDVARGLDASVPDVETRCPRCKAKLREWARFCTQCGLDVSGEAPASGEHASRAALREKVRAATEGRYDFLGDIPRAEGGGLVYFARDLADGRIVALRLQRDINKALEVGVTRTLKAAEPTNPNANVRRAPGRPAITIVQRGPIQRAGTTPASSAPAASPNEPPAAAPAGKWDAWMRTIRGWLGRRR